jgi:hypothetical protein
MVTLRGYRMRALRIDQELGLRSLRWHARSEQECHGPFSEFRPLLRTDAGLLKSEA